MTRDNAVLTCKVVLWLPWIFRKNCKEANLKINSLLLLMKPSTDTFSISNACVILVEICGSTSAASAGIKYFVELNSIRHTHMTETV